MAKNENTAIQKPRGVGNVTTLAAYLNARKGAIAQVMARGMDPERVLKIALSAASRSPLILKCSADSIYTSIHTAVQLGLEPGGPLGHAYLVPRWNSKINGYECTFVLGYQGMIELARRSAQVTKLYARSVYERDTFDVQLGLHEDLKHVPCFDGDRGRLRFVYAVAHVRDAEPQFVILAEHDIDRIRSHSDAFKKGFGPWKDHEESMWLKSSIRQLFKFLPKRVDTPEAQRAVDAIAADDTLEVSFDEATPDDTRELPEATPDAPERAESRTAEIRERVRADTGEIRAPSEAPAELRSSEQLSFEARSRVEELKAIDSTGALAKWRKRREAEINQLPPHEQDAVATVYQQRVAELS